MRYLAYLILAFVAAAPLARAEEKPSSTAELKASTAQLNKDWDKSKAHYKHSYKEQLVKIDSKIKELEGELDGGDREKRSRINEELADLRRVRTDITQIFNEMTASSGIKLGNLKGDVKDAVEDMKD